MGRRSPRMPLAAHRGGTIMATVTTIARGRVESSLPAPRVRIGMIIPSVNSMTEPQFNHFAPPGLGVHVARARVAGEWKRPLAAMADEIAMSAKLLADVAPDLIVFHCTDTSMTQGPQDEGGILKIVQDATGIEAVATSRLVLEALQALGLRRLVLLSPYKSNQAVIDYLGATGFTVVHDVALARKALEFATVTPREWVELARKHDRPDADGIFLSCTNNDADRSDRGYRAGPRQAGRQQQPGGALGLRQAARVRACSAAADAVAWPADAAHGCVSAISEDRTYETARWTSCRRGGISHALCCGRDRATLSDAADHARRSLRARRARRFSRPPHRPEDERRFGPANRRRQSAGREHHHRGPGGRQGQPRRLHAADGDRRHAGHESVPLQQACLRSVQGFRADFADRARALGGGRKHQHSRQLDQGTGGAGKG